MNFHMFSMFWGAHHLDLFKRACYRSLNWDANLSALQGREWHVYTLPEHFEDLERLFNGGPFKLILKPIGESMRVSGCGMVRTAQCDAGVVLLNGLRDQIAYSIQNRSKMLFCPPDTLFGNGTIPNLLTIGQGPATCVAVSHPRVLPAMFEDLESICATRGALSNPQLVTLAFRHAHDSWKYADVVHKNNSSFVGGIAWRELEKGLYSVTHRLPTVYLADFLPMDYDFFWGQVSFGGWDHRWPAENLIRHERMRLVGSSDACFIVELTDHDKNVPPELPLETKQELARRGEVDGYWNSHYHNSINRQFTTIFRGE